MQEFKIIFAGSMGAGKTTAIKALSDKEVISTDVANSDKKAHNKLLTTVGIDYGQIILPPDTKVGLYGRLLTESGKRTAVLRGLFP